jgi:hypothetical protein
MLCKEGVRKGGSGGKGFTISIREQQIDDSSGGMISLI